MSKGPAVDQSGGFGVRISPPIRRLLNSHLAMIARMRLDYGEAVKAIDSLLYRYGFYVEEYPIFVSSDSFRFTVDYFQFNDQSWSKSVASPVVNSMLVMDGYLGKLEVAYLS